MVEAAAQPSGPHGKVFYSAKVLLASFLVVGFTWGLFHVRNAPLGSDFFGAVLLTIFLVTDLQALERLLLPEKAIQRSRSFSDSVRLKMRTACNVIWMMGTAGLLSGPVVRLLGFRDAGTDLGEISAVLVFASSGLADLIGERLFQPMGT